MTMHALVADLVAAGSVLDWYKQKLDAIKALIQPTLMVVALFFVIVSYMMYRSWKKAVIAGIGGAIVVAIVANITGIADKVKSEINGAPVTVMQSRDRVR